MNEQLIKLFKVALNEQNEKIDFKTVNTEAVAKGYIVHPDACTRSVLKFIKEENVDYNSTFYKTFQEVTSKNRFELFIDQVMHYASTYGTSFAGDTYIANEDVYVEHKFSFDKYTVINAVSREELFDKCTNILYSGIALKKETMTACADFIIECSKSFDMKFDIDCVKNREALIYICNKLDILPSAPVNLFKYIVYVSTGETLIIKNTKLINMIKDSVSCYTNKAFDFNKLTDEQIIKLSSVFYRFKPLFLAFKTKKNANVINKIRRFAVKYHTPMKVGFLESFLTENAIKKYATGMSSEMDNLMADVSKSIETCNSFKLVRFIQLIKEKTCRLLERLQNIAENKDTVYKNMYIVRNGKSFVKDTECGYTPDELYNIINVLNKIYDKVYTKLVENVKKNVDGNGSFVPTFIKNTVVDVACPVSEKNFVGDYPLGSRYKLASDNIIGCYWRNEWGTRDFDLSFNSCNGDRIGWNSSYYDESIDDIRQRNRHSMIYSGDMTDAYPSATECIYFTDKAINGVFDVNRYNGNQGSEFELFVTKTDKFEKNKEYMVNPNDIVFKTRCISEDKQQMVGILCDGYFYLNNVSTGNCIVTRTSNFTPNDIYNIYVMKSKSVLYLNDLLEDAGYKFVTPEEADEHTVNLEEITKADIIKMFS